MIVKDDPAIEQVADLGDLMKSFLVLLSYGLVNFQMYMHTKNQTGICSW